ncbi:MAG TPA: DUF3098 domain-containing protein [Chitinophagales bacterium]|nr:DUF3098 domain-containing protein [Chitinophagales bacterium]
MAKYMAKPLFSVKKEQSQKPAFIFGKINFILMIAGIMVIAAGYLLMTGGAPDDPAVFNADEKYSFRRITLAPLVILIGFVIEVFAIFVKARD